MQEPIAYNTPEQPKKNNTGLIIGISVAVLLCCCCLLVLVLGWNFGDALIQGLQSL